MPKGRVRHSALFLGLYRGNEELVLCGEPGDGTQRAVVGLKFRPIVDGTP